jgi:hypothetical protein
MSPDDYPYLIESQCVNITVPPQQFGMRLLDPAIDVARAMAKDEHISHVRVIEQRSHLIKAAFYN